MELRNYLAILWRRKWLIVVTVIVTTIFGFVAALTATPTYTASATVRVLTARGGSGDFVEYDLQYADRLMNTYVKIATSRPILDELARHLNLSVLPAISVEILANTELIQITAEHPNPTVARDAANTVTELLIAQSRMDRRLRANTLSVVEPAVMPDGPSMLEQFLPVVLAGMVGVAGSIGLALLFESLDTTLYTREQIEAVADGGPTVGQIPTFKRRTQVDFLNDHTPEGEAFRRLRANVVIPDRTEPLKTLLISSAEPGEGKSTVVANLALAMAHAGQQVIIVDGDMRLPTMHRLFDLPNDTGLSTILEQGVDLCQVLQNSDIPSIKVLTSGPQSSNPTALLGSAEMMSLLELLKQQSDLVLVDTPALLAVTDAAVIASMVDGVLLVVRRAKTRREMVDSAREQLQTVQARFVGLVVNRANPTVDYLSYYD